MKYTLTPNKTSLVITVDDAERAELINWKEERAGHANENICSDLAMHDFFEKFIGNSEFDWVNPADTGDLTDAPMLGTFKEVNEERQVVERWAFMDYQVMSVLEALRDSGQAVFIGGPLNDREEVRAAMAGVPPPQRSEVPLDWPAMPRVNRDRRGME